MNHLEGLALMHAHALPLRWNQPTPGDWADVLATFPLFTGISKRRLRKLARRATLAEFAPGETIVFAGDRGDALCVVLGGAAKTARPGGPGFRTGEYFGEVAVLNRRARSAAVVATSNAHVMRLPARDVLKLARRHPELTLAILKNVAAQLRRLENRDALAT
jgi:CRP-like cAMP-binding protein